MPLFADCEGLVGVATTVLFLLFSAGGWILQQIAEANKRAEATRRAAMARQVAGSAGAKLPGTSPERGVLVGPYEATMVEEPPAETAPRTLTTMRSSVTTSALVEHAAHLGEEAAHAGDRMQARLQSQFDSEVGTMGDSSDAVHEKRAAAPPTATAVAATASEIALVLRNPARILEALILGEILRRPDEESH